MKIPQKALLTAGFLREKCQETLSARCGVCGTPFQTAGDALCAVCGAADAPITSCSRCGEAVSNGSSKAERACHSVAVYKRCGSAAFAPKERLWAIKKSGDGEAEACAESDLLARIRSKKLPETALVRPEGDPRFVQVRESQPLQEALGRSTKTETPEPVPAPRPAPPAPVPAPEGSGFSGFLGSLAAVLLVSAAALCILLVFGRAPEARELLRPFAPFLSDLPTGVFHGAMTILVLLLEWILLAILLAVLPNFGLRHSPTAFWKLIEWSGWVACMTVFDGSDFLHFGQVVDWAQTSVFEACDWNWIQSRPVHWTLNTIFFLIWAAGACGVLVPAVSLISSDSKKPSPGGR